MTADRLSVALVWHMHQPYYRDDVAGQFLLPWVRRRGSKDYLHMLRILERHPEVRVTMNMVPSLLLQLETYARGDVRDADRDLCLRDAVDLTSVEARFLVGAALLNDYGRRVPLLAPLMGLLADLRGRDATAIPVDELRDLQLWSLLAWVDPDDIRADPVLTALAQQGRHFSEADKAAVDSRQLALVGEVIPAYREAVARGQVEPMTTPLQHPILPLLIDQASARIAVPDMALVEPPLRVPSDAEDQVRRGLAQFQRITGGAAAGMWPAECSVSPAAAQLMHDCGVRFAVSDEGVLSRTLGGSDVRATGDLYRAHADASGLVMVFRDADLSNRVGFSYQFMEPAQAAAHLVERLEEIAREAGDDVSRRLVTIALDGENFKDAYAENGTPFLDCLYTGLAASDRLVSSTIGGFLDRHPDPRTLPELWSGSWIDADFRTWIGEQSHTRAWQLLAATRASVEEAGGAASHPRAHDEVLIAEASDWFWWFGPHHNSGSDEAWDELYRTHLRNAHTLAGLPVPAGVDQPILGGTAVSGDCEPLRGINPTRDGETEWAAAGIAMVGAVFGAMRPPASSVTRILYGAGGARLHLRFGDSAPRFERARVDAGPIGSLLLTQPTRSVSVAAPAGTDLEFAVSLEEAGRGVERVPGRGHLRVSVIDARQPRVAIVAAECAPLAVAGALADVVAGTARDAAALGYEVLVIIPHHRDVHLGGPTGTRVPDLVAATDGHRRGARALQGRLPGTRIPVLTIDCPELFNRDAIYGEGDDGARYLEFCVLAETLLQVTAFAPDIVHGFEWQSSALLARLATGTNRMVTVLSVGAESPGYRVDAAAAARAGLADGPTGGVDLLDVGRLAAHVVEVTPPRAPLGALYRGALVR